jgi:hypothetical protein
MREGEREEEKERERERGREGRRWKKMREERILTGKREEIGEKKAAKMIWKRYDGWEKRKEMGEKRREKSIKEDMGEIEIKGSERTYIRKESWEIEIER